MGKIEIKYIRRAFAHPSFPASMTAVGCFGLLQFAILAIEGTAQARAHLLQFPALAGYYAIGFGVLNYQLVSGHWSVHRWTRWIAVFFVSIGGYYFYYGFTAPRYAFFPICLLIGGALLPIGVATRRQFSATAGALALLYFVVGLTLERIDLTNALMHISLVAGIALVFHWVGISSEHMRTLRHNASRLLLSSRSDKRTIAEERKKSDNLLLNILPAQIATELTAKNAVRPTRFESASVMFTDFSGFTQIAETMTPEELVAELDQCFSYFDSLMERHHLEKLKTIGDAFMCAGGIPVPNNTHAIDCVLAAMEIQAFMTQMKELKQKQGLPYWELRLGIHSGPLVAGVIGEKKFAYDVWGDTVNTASRAESSGAVGRINVTGATYALVKDFFECEHRGSVPAKNKGEIDMYFVNGIRSELSRDGEGRVPNDKFEKSRDETGFRT